MYKRQIHFELARSLKRKPGIEQTIFVSRQVAQKQRRRRVKEGELEGATVIESENFSSLDRLRPSLKARKISTAIDAAIDVATFDVIHAHTLSSGGLVARMLSSKYQIPYVSAVRNTDINVFLRWPILFRHQAALLADEAAQLIFVNSAYMAQLTEKLGNKGHIGLEGKSVQISNGIDEFWLTHVPEASATSHNQQVRILTVGVIDKNKNQIGLIEAADSLSQKGFDVALSIIGEGSHERAVRDAASTKGFEISILPWTTSKEELLEAYRSHNVFAMPSFRETFGVVYIEAISQGLPVVHARGQGIDGLFPNGVASFAVDPADHKSIAKGILDAFHSEAGVTQKVFEPRQFNWDDIARRYVDVYRNATKAS